MLHGMVSNELGAYLRSPVLGIVAVVLASSSFPSAGYGSDNPAYTPRLQEVSERVQKAVPSGEAHTLGQPNPKRVTHVYKAKVIPRSSWRVVGSKILREEGVYSDANLALLLKCINRESTGNPSARNGQHIGLLQFNNNWGSEEQRLNPEWSIRRWARVLREEGVSGIRRHWTQWW